MSDLTENPPTVKEGPGTRLEIHDFSNEWVTATVSRITGDKWWHIQVDITDAEIPRHAQDEIAAAVRKAADAVTLLNKPTKTVTADQAFSDEIRVLLADREWTFRQAAAEFGIELGRFGNLVCGQTRWTVTDLYKIAEAISDDPAEEFARLAQIGRSALTSENHAEWLTPEQTARFTGRPVDVLAEMRRRRVGPPFVKASRETMYRRDEVERWLEENDN
ncbi:helix-turn-helix domain-containing protein [Microbacterium sp. A1-JK]|uniref:helix-turn-helix domain-containing protein n=1 Tax=Microbacterium sp. A1-JK TaxID=3177516 RepID=UPI00388A1F17